MNNKPAWLLRREEEKDRERFFKKCVTCKNKGELCGQTTYIEKVGRLPMYLCKIHPTVRFHERSLACGDYEKA